MVQSRSTRGSVQNLQKWELTRWKETFLPLEGGSVLEHVPREAGEWRVLDKFRNCLMNALSNLVSSFSVIACCDNTGNFQRFFPSGIFL